MTEKQIKKLITEDAFPEHSGQVELIETHISWVLRCDQYVYKVKKPMKYVFLDFSTLERRRYYCIRELELNQRFARNIYLEVLPIRERGGSFKIGGKEEDGQIIEYALKMRKLDPDKQMDVLLAKNEVRVSDIKNLAHRIANFHRGAKIISQKNLFDLKEKFNALESESGFLAEHLDIDVERFVSEAIAFSDSFLDASRQVLKARLDSGFFRDVHGDLHTRNIFLLPEPQPFDCIEFSDDYRQIDVLNEVAFLGMDLDALGRKDFSGLFLDTYNQLFPSIRSGEEYRLFIYYKCYRANVRAKVNGLRAKSAADIVTKTKALSEAGKYLSLMQGYLEALKRS